MLYPLSYRRKTSLHKLNTKTSAFVKAIRPGCVFYAIAGKRKTPCDFFT